MKSGQLHCHLERCLKMKTVTFMSLILTKGFSRSLAGQTRTDTTIQARGNYSRGHLDY